MIPRGNGDGGKAGADLAGLILTAEAMIAEVPDERGDGGMGGMGMGM